MMKLSARLPRCLLSVSVLCLASLPFLAEEPQGTALSGPRIEVDAAEIDLGTLDKGVAAEATFTLRNSGDQVLKILRAKPG